MRRVETYLVAMACQVLEAFCVDHGAREDLTAGILAHFAVAWREGDFFEWTPPRARDFYRIVTLTQRPGESTKMVLAVYKSDERDEVLTAELNRAIFRFTDGRW